MSNIPLEKDEQIALVQYLDIKKLKYSAIPNSTYTSSWNQKNLNKQMGLRAGLPDLLIYISPEQSRTKTASLLFIELKRQKLSHVSEVQKEWIQCLNTVDNVEAFVCRGYDEAKNIIDEYII